MGKPPERGGSPSESHARARSHVAERQFRVESLPNEILRKPTQNRHRENMWNTPNVSRARQWTAALSREAGALHAQCDPRRGDESELYEGRRQDCRKTSPGTSWSLEGALQKNKHTSKSTEWCCEDELCVYMLVFMQGILMHWEKKVWSKYVNLGRRLLLQTGFLVLVFKVIGKLLGGGVLLFWLEFRSDDILWIINLEIRPILKGSHTVCLLHHQKNIWLLRVNNVQFKATRLD